MRDISQIVRTGGLSIGDSSGVSRFWNSIRLCYAKPVSALHKRPGNLEIVVWL